MPRDLTIETRLNGLFPPDFASAERINLSRLWRDLEAPPPTPVTIADARPLQAAATSEADFLDARGFVLLDAPTAVSGWSDPAEIAGIYHREVEALIRTRLYPGRALRIVQPPAVVRRGAGTENPQYGTGVHCDHDRAADDYQHSVAAYSSAEIAARWRQGYEAARGFVVLDFWRTTGMKEPLRHMPLALCDAASVDPADIVSTALEGIAPGGAVSRLAGLRRNPGQSWYYYPAMRPEEVLVFKLLELGRGDAGFRACFHSAFEDPTAPADAPPRQSCEHRVSVFLLD